MVSPQKGNVNYMMVIELANAIVLILLCINVLHLYIIHVKVIQCYLSVMSQKKLKKKKFQGPNSEEHFRHNKEFRYYFTQNFPYKPVASMLDAHLPVFIQ